MGNLTFVHLINSFSEIEKFGEKVDKICVNSSTLEQLKRLPECKQYIDYEPNYLTGIIGSLFCSKIVLNELCDTPVFVSNNNRLYKFAERKCLDNNKLKFIMEER
jgi:hypothetical protein